MGVDAAHRAKDSQRRSVPAATAHYSFDPLAPAHSDKPVQTGQFNDLFGLCDDWEVQRRWNDKGRMEICNPDQAMPAGKTAKIATLHARVTSF
jgi:hypothetical protein